MKNVVVWGYWAGNLGDDLFLLTLCARYPKINFHIVCELRFAKAFLNVSNIIVHEDIKSLTLDYILQIFLGGSLFIQPNEKNQIQYKFYDTTKFNILNCPYIVIGANFGPYNEIEFYSLYYNWFKKAQDICFRDKWSKEQFCQFNNVRWAPDIILNRHTFFNNIYLPESSKFISFSLIKNNKRLGLPVYSEKAYVNLILTIINKYIELGFEIKLLSFCPNQGDTIIAHEIYSNLSSVSKIKTSILEYNGDVLSFIKDGFDCSYLIGTRFHSIILSWALKKRVLPIVYNIKTKNAIVDYEYPYDYLDITNLTNITF